jgi:hypothetical protein
VINEVRVVVTGSRAPGDGYVIPYNAKTTPHLQHYVAVSGYVDPNRYVTYVVPFYKIQIVNGGLYKALRFGLRNRGDNLVPSRRPCDTGLSHSRICTPTFLPHYRPHSFLGQGPPGAWQLLPGKSFLVHEGGDSNRDVVGGSVGCIEIVDGGWRSFQDELESLAGGTCAAIGASRRLTVVIEPAPYPTAVLF